MILVHILVIAMALYLGFGVLYQLFYALTGLLPSPQPIAKDDRLRKFAVFIPSYKDDAVIVQTAKAALRQRYPIERYEVVVMADKLRPETVASLRKLPIKVIEVSFSESTKSKSLREGIAALKGSRFDGAIILDADNRMAPDFMLEANRYMSAGFRAIQGQRTAPPAVLNDTAKWDAISEAVNNHILCAGHHAIGLSARLAGSGMIFDYQLFADIMQDVHAIGGFDKELELKLTQARESIAYAENAVVYDEKVSNPEVFGRQRGRWLAAQYKYAQRFFGKAFVAFVTKGQGDFFNKALQMALPPRLLLPVALLLLATVCLPFSTGYSALFAGLFLLNVASFGVAIPPSMWETASWMLVSKLPAMIWQACKAVVMIPASAKTFYHTPHAELAPQETENV